MVLSHGFRVLCLLTISLRWWCYCGFAWHPSLVTLSLTPQTCSFKNVSTIGTTVHDNRVYALGGAVVSGCGQQISVTDWLALGADPGTTMYNFVVCFVRASVWVLFFRGART